jgi:hypothetical protein
MSVKVPPVSMPIRKRGCPTAAAIRVSAPEAMKTRTGGEKKSPVLSLP